VPTGAFHRDSVFYRLKPGFIPGDQISYVIKIENDAFVNSDTITRIFGPATVVFEDDFDDIDNWETDDWSIRDNEYFSPQYSVANLAGDYYPNNSDTYLLYNDIILQDETDAIWVNFKAKWDLDGGRDYVKTVYSTDLGQSWIPLKGRFSSTIIGDEEFTTVYEGSNEEWITERILITGIKNIPLKFGFHFTSDGKYGRSGFYCDDFRIFTSDMETTAQSISIEAGWTGISTYLIPINSDISAIFSEHIGEVEFLMNDDQFYQPGNIHGTLTSWNPPDGLMIKASQPFQLIIIGYPDGSVSMNLNAGWNLISILSDQPVDVNNLASEPSGAIQSIKEACGIKTWWPEKNIEVLSNLLPGKSYFILMAQDAKLKIE
jgi:hypothetical protein